MSSIYVYREQAYPDVYEQKPFHPPTLKEQVEQNAYTFRARSIQTPQQEPGRTLQGKPKLSVRAHKSPHYPANAPSTQIEMKCQKPPQPALPSRSAIEELRNELIYQDELRRARHEESEKRMRQLAESKEESTEGTPWETVQDRINRVEREIAQENKQAGSGYRKPAQRGKGKDCYTVIAEEKDGNECYTVMTGGKKTKSIQEIENAITILKSNGYRLFKSKLARGFKQVRKSRAKQKY
jgi:hypothetical protein